MGKQILLQAVDGSWGIGVAYKHSGKVYFNYTALEPVRGWMGMDKDHFSGWATI